MTTVAGIHLGPDTHANRPAATAVTAGTLYACTTDSKIYVSDGSTWADWADYGGGGGGGGGAPGWVNYLASRQTGETSHSDDDFFDDATKTGITEIAPTGTVTWTENHGLLSAKYVSVGSNDAGCALKPLTPSAAPVTVETAVKWQLANVNYNIVGVCLTDGVVAGSNFVGLSFWSSALRGLRAVNGTITNFDAVNTSILSTAGNDPMVGRLYMRVIWTAANTFEIAHSIDGVSWTKNGAADISKTMTPTHFGVFVTNYGNATESIAAFDYLRVNESDLSV